MMGMNTDENQLFLQLIYDKQTQRWFQIIELLESGKFLFGSEISQKLAITRRTLITDIKKLNQVFEGKMHIWGEDQGYNLRLLEPKNYYQAKQILLEKEPLFLLLDGLLRGEKHNLKNWADQLNQNVSSFQRCKQQLVNILDKYHLALTLDDCLRIKGNENQIRHFFYVLYYEQKVLPKKMLETRKNIEEKISIKLELKTPWCVEAKKSKGWAAISNQRQQIGNILSEQLQAKPELVHSISSVFLQNISNESLENKLSQIVCVLYSLDKTILLDLNLQQQVVERFLPREFKQEMVDCIRENEISSQALFIFLVTWVYLLDQFKLLFQPLSTSEENIVLPPDFQRLKSIFSSEGRKYFTVLVQQWKQISFEIGIEWNLFGQKIVQEWIKEFFEKEAKIEGIILLKEAKEPFKDMYLPKVRIANTRLASDLDRIDIQLSEIPSREEIKKVCRNLKKYLIDVQREVIY